jgi:alkylhydroperoxidase AhpD family core domain
MTLEMLNRNDPEVLKSLYAYRREVFKEGELSLREKELIALATAIVNKCETCYEYHANAALKAGATPRQILEMEEVVMYMNGPSAMIWSKKIDEYSE